MNIFEISAVEVDGEPKFMFTDNNCKILVEGFDFSRLDTDSKDYSMYVTIYKRDKRKITNFQFKKKLTRTMNELFRSAIENAVNTGD